MRLRWPYIAVGYAVLIAVVIAGFYAGQYRKKWEQIRKLDKEIATEEKKIAERPDIEKKMRDTRAQLARLNAEFEAIRQAKMAPINFEDPLLATVAIWFEQREDVGPAILELFVRAGVLPQSINIPAPPMVPVPVQPQEVLHIPPGRMTVTFTATLDQLLDLLYSFGEAKRLIATGDSIAMAPVDPSGGLLQVTLPIELTTFAKMPKGAPQALAAGPGPVLGGAAAGPGAAPGLGAGAPPGIGGAVGSRGGARRGEKSQ